MDKEKEHSLSTLIDSLILAALIGVMIFFCSYVSYQRGYDKGWSDMRKDTHIGRVTK